MFILPRILLAVAHTAYLHSVCRTIGHNTSWVLGAALGHNRPVCERCRTVIR